MNDDLAFPLLDQHRLVGRGRHSVWVARHRLPQDVGPEDLGRLSRPEVVAAHVSATVGPRRGSPGDAARLQGALHGIGERRGRDDGVRVRPRTSWATSSSINSAVTSGRQRRGRRPVRSQRAPARPPPTAERCSPPATVATPGPRSTSRPGGSATITGPTLLGGGERRQRPLEHRPAGQGRRGPSGRRLGVALPGAGGRDHDR